MYLQRGTRLSKSTALSISYHIYLVECKDEKATDIEAIAKLRNQLMRRPDTTLGCVFTREHFTTAAVIVADFATPQRILLWSRGDIEGGLEPELCGCAPG